jgi:hypothetical protein
VSRFIEQTLPELLTALTTEQDADVLTELCDEIDRRRATETAAGRRCWVDRRSAPRTGVDRRQQQRRGMTL